MSNNFPQKMTNYRWVICSMLFLATTVNYLDRQVLSLTWKDFIAPEFHWTHSDYGDITAAFSIFYAFVSLFSFLLVPVFFLSFIFAANINNQNVSLIKQQKEHEETIYPYCHNVFRCGKCTSN